MMPSSTISPLGERYNTLRPISSGFGSIPIYLSRILADNRSRNAFASSTVMYVERPGICMNNFPSIAL